MSEDKYVILEERLSFIENEYKSFFQVYKNFAIKAASFSSNCDYVLAAAGKMMHWEKSIGEISGKLFVLGNSYERINNMLTKLTKGKVIPEHLDDHLSQIQIMVQNLAAEVEGLRIPDDYEPEEVSHDVC